MKSLTQSLLPRRLRKTNRSQDRDASATDQAATADTAATKSPGKTNADPAPDTTTAPGAARAKLFAYLRHMVWIIRVARRVPITSAFHRVSVTQSRNEQVQVANSGKNQPVTASAQPLECAKTKQGPQQYPQLNRTMWMMERCSTFSIPHKKLCRKSVHQRTDAITAHFKALCAQILRHSSATRTLTRQLEHSLHPAAQTPSLLINNLRSACSHS